MLHVYRNVAWAPRRAALTPAAAAAAGQISYFPAAAGTDLTGTPAALPDSDGRTTARGPVSVGAYVYLAEASSGDWHLTVDGHAMPRAQAFGWANGFAVDRSGRATLSFRTPLTRYSAVLIAILFCVCAIRLVWRSGPPPRAPARRAAGGGR